MTASSQPETSTLKAPLIDRLARLVDLTARERAYLGQVQVEFARVHAGTDIITAGHAYRCFFILNQGLAMRYKVLHDGRRQILSLVMPGDFIGFPGCLFERSLYSIASLAEAVTCTISFNVLFDLFRRHPKLGAAFFWLSGHETALIAEHLVGVGRQSAYERVARLLMELLVRLQNAGLADERSYSLPMTQELMADALGLSVPHVNRTLRKLREDGLIDLQGSRITCLDVPALSRLADFDGANLAGQRIPGL